MRINKCVGRHYANFTNDEIISIFTICKFAITFNKFIWGDFSLDDY